METPKKATPVPEPVAPSTETTKPLALPVRPLYDDHVDCRVSINS